MLLAAEPLQGQGAELGVDDREQFGGGLAGLFEHGRYVPRIAVRIGRHAASPFLPGPSIPDAPTDSKARPPGPGAAWCCAVSDRGSRPPLEEKRTPPSCRGVRTAASGSREAARQFITGRLPLPKPRPSTRRDPAAYGQPAAQRFR